MEAVLDRMAWFKKTDLKETQIIDFMERYTLNVEDDYGTKKELILYDDNSDFLGLPRNFFTIHLTNNLELYNNTVWQSMPSFPQFKGDLRKGQDAAIARFLDSIYSETNRYGGILQGACGSGKTCVALYLLSKLKAKTVVLLHKSDLMDQWKERIEQFLPGCKVGIIRQNKKEIEGCHIVLAMYQTLYSRKHDFISDKTLNKFSIVVVDEVHRVSCVTFNDVIKLLPASIRIGLTATPTRKDETEMAFFSHIGPVVTEMRVDTEVGEYCQIKWKSDIPIKSVMYRNKLNFSKLVNKIVEDEKRNDYIYERICGACRKKRKIVALTDRLSQVEYLYKRLLNDGFSVGFYVGGMSPKELNYAKKQGIILATYKMMSEATDIPDADTMFLMTPVSDITQPVGRIQRKHKDKQDLMVFDIVDSLPMCVAMGKKREKILVELGFKKFKSASQCTGGK